MKENEPKIGVHCVAGLGRAPLLVALALIYKGCPKFKFLEYSQEMNAKAKKEGL